jgi:hypothetical protein
MKGKDTHFEALPTSDERKQMVVPSREFIAAVAG